MLDVWGTLHFFGHTISGGWGRLTREEAPVLPLQSYLLVWLTAVFRSSISCMPLPDGIVFVVCLC